MKTIFCVRVLTPLIAAGIAVASLALPGFHIRDDASVKRSVSLYADDPDQFRAVVYQASLDKNTWRLALEAYNYLHQKPGDPARECSFTQAYWQSQEAVTVENVPPVESQKLRGLYDEAYRDTKDAARKLPLSVAAHVTYGQYLQWFGLMDKSNAPVMLREYREAVALDPKNGELHYKLANGFFGSGILNKPRIAEMITQYKEALQLDPKLTQCYFWIACSYWQEQDWHRVTVYLDKYVAANPAAATRPDVVWARKTVQEKLGSQ